MCGRYAAAADPEALVEAFEVELDATGRRSRSLLARPQDPPAGTPDYNMAPTKQAPVVLSRAPRGEDAGDPVRQLRLLTWGLVPGWATGPSVGQRMINARVESVLDKPAFARAVSTRRCLVPAQAWYEWQASPVAVDRRGKPRRHPFAITRADDAPLAFAGLYAFWKDPAATPDDDEAWVVSFTILTQAAEPGLDRIHDRQPMVVDPQDWSAWLDPATTASEAVRPLLAPGAPGRFTAWPVGRAVNATRHGGPGLLDPALPEELEGVVDPSTGEVIGS